MMVRNRFSARAALVVLSALLYTAVFPPWNQTWLAWVALVPLLAALRGATPRAGLAAGLLWGVAMIWGIGIWLPPALADYYQQPLWFGLAFSAVASVYFIGIYHGAYGLSAAWFGARTTSFARIAGLALLWVAWEFVKSRFLTGDPWLLLGYALAPVPVLAQLADLGGVYGLSFVVVLANAALAEALLEPAAPRRRMAYVGLALAVAAANGAYGYARLGLPVAAEPTVPVVVVQGNNDMGAQWRREFYGRGLDTYLNLSWAAVPKNRRSLIVWPESAVTFFLADDEAFRRPIQDLVAAANADLIVGGPFREVVDGEERYYNSAFYMRADGTLADRYDKAHLLPFAEYFPLRTVEFLRRRFERVRYFMPGSGETVLETEFGKVATVICFEGMFPEIVGRQMRRGARLLINLSNDAWLGRGAGPEQHMLMIALRAIENRVWVIRATTTGISSLIDPFGRVVQRTEQNAAEVLKGSVVPLEIATVYKRHGDVFAWACVGAAAVAMLAAGLRRRPAVVAVTQPGAAGRAAA